jgi:lipopolysaccharide transport system ATP-binding protein
MSEIVIKAENLGKKYIIGHQGKGGYKTFREQVGHGLHGLLSKTKQLFTGQQMVEGDEVEEFWALKELNFEINQGDRVGIIGRNGAGKSTLLKVLSRITEPTTGKVSIKGRVASLLEVGTGFHPELTGRENIFLNGAIMGMSRAEIKRKFDEIVDFSGVERFLDTPVKRYSSGMYVRLAFSVAAHLEPEILVVDEVLAVGDAEFQKKCLGKMQDVSASEGRTVLFVSHNMAALQNLCNKSMVLSKGKVSLPLTETDIAVSHYLEKVFVKKAIDIASRKDRIGLGEIRIVDFIIVNGDGHEQALFASGQRVNFKFYYECTSHFSSLNLVAGIAVTNSEGLFVTELSNYYTHFSIKTNEQKGCIVCSIPRLPLTKGDYSLNIIIRNNGIIQDWIKDASILSVENGDFYGTGRSIAADLRIVLFDQQWSVEKPS